MAQWIPINQASAGMILAENLMRNNTVVLMQKGTALDDSVLARLKKLGIDGLTVEEQHAEGEMKELKREHVAVVEAKFRKHRDNPLMDAIRKSTLQCLSDN